MKIRLGVALFARLVGRNALAVPSPQFFWLIHVPLIEQLVSLDQDKKGLQRPFGNRKQVVANPFCLIQIDSSADQRSRTAGWFPLLLPKISMVRGSRSVME